jgi:hypothetical protein
VLVCRKSFILLNSVISWLRLESSVAWFLSVSLAVFSWAVRSATLISRLAFSCASSAVRSEMIDWSPRP